MVLEGKRPEPGSDVFPASPRTFGFILSQPYPARRHKLGCLCLCVLISARAFTLRLADLRAFAPIGAHGLLTERLRRSLTACLRHDSPIPNRKAYPESNT